jgi:uncharacterized protein YegL
VDRRVSAPLRPVYVLLDTSGSTVRDGFSSACERALPQLVDAAGRHPGVRLSVLTYATKAQSLVPISVPDDIGFIPVWVPAGLSSLASGLWLLAESVRQDTSQLAADGLACQPPCALVVADGLPTDPAADLLAARGALDAALAELADTAVRTPDLVYAALPDDGDRLAIAGLCMAFRQLTLATPDEMAASILAVFDDLLGG